MSATKKTRPKKTKNMSEEDLDSWAQSIPSLKSCHTCKEKAAAETLRRLLGALARNGVTHVTLRNLHKTLREFHPNYSVGYWGFRDHLYQCERELYNKMRENK